MNTPTVKPDFSDIDKNLAAMGVELDTGTEQEKPRPGDIQNLDLDPGKYSFGARVEQMGTDEPQRKYILDSIMIEGVTGLVYAEGGVGKSFFYHQLGLALSTGRQWGPFKPARAYKVLYLAGEDDDAELNFRTWHINKVMNPDLDGYPNNFVPVSLTRYEKSLMAGDPSAGLKRAGAYYKLIDLIRAAGEQHGAFDIVILEPLSRFYGGLSENDNAVGSFFIEGLDIMKSELELSALLMAHHVSKAGHTDETPDNPRGASSILDNVRWGMSMGHMQKKTAENHGISPAHCRRYVAYQLRKTNYTASWSAPYYFERSTEHQGVLIPCNIRKNRLIKASSYLSEALSGLLPALYTRSAIHKHEAAIKPIRDGLKEQFNMRVCDIPALIDFAIENHYLTIDGGKVKPLEFDTSER